ncbi:MAG: N-acetylmuramoyl-L-alanine amidase [Aliidongia sp.]|jgi:N-acetylmuramoyl-L-alanine amidase|nr:N-acetylmuramoyl-L-alanine amidase [Aliidongia sp.]
MSGWAERPSPNHGPRRPGAPIDLLLLHYTGMATADAALERLTDPVAEVGCHWLIDEDGTIYRLIDEDRRAWHAGRGFWAGERDVNSRSIGIELVNPGHEFGYRPFPPVQMAALVELARGILARHPIPPHRVLGHSDVAPDRKRDPGELFDWAWLAARGIGVWPAPAADVLSLDVAADLARIGYEKANVATIAAFQRHFHTARIDGVADGGTRSRIAQIARAIPLTE